MGNLSLGEKIAESGINWGEVVLRVFMALMHILLVALLFVSSRTYDTKGEGTAFFVLAFVAVTGFGLYHLIPVARAIWLLPRLTIYQNGVSYQDRAGERAWKWHELSHFELEQGFGMTIYGTYVWRRGLLTVYDNNDEIAFQINRLFSNAYKIAQITANTMPKPKPKKVKEEPLSTVHPLL